MSYYYSPLLAEKRYDTEYVRKKRWKKGRSHSHRNKTGVGNKRPKMRKRMRKAMQSQRFG